MNEHIFTVCGAGRAGSTMAADMALMGYKINLFELETFNRSIEPIIRRGGIELSGMSQSGETGLAILNRVTTKAKEAIEESDLILICAPAFGHRAFFKAIMPYLKKGQAVMVNTGYWASLRVGNMLRNEGVLDKIILGEANILPYLCDKSEHKVHVYNIKKDIQLATFPGGGEMVTGSLNW